MKLNVITYLSFIALLICSCSSDSAETEVPTNPPSNGDTPGEGGETPDSPELPEVRTLELGELVIAYALFQGQLISEGDSPVTEIGFVIGTEEGATIESNFSRHPIPEDSSDEFSLMVYDIPASVDYYLRAYAISEAGVGYGSDVMFRTLDENVYEGDVYLDTQEKVEEFGAMEITTIIGFLTITGTVNDLNPLNHLERVSSGVDIMYTSDLITLEGLNKLTHTGYLVGNAFRIASNTGLESLNGLSSLEIATGGLLLSSNSALINLKGLEMLKSIGIGGFSPLAIDNNINLTSLEGLENLKEVSELFIVQNPLLSDLSALSSLENIQKSLNVWSCNSLLSLNGFQGLTRVDQIECWDNAGITSLIGLENMEEIRIIVINDNDALTDISALGGIRNNDVTLSIHENDALIDLSGLEQITFISELNVNYNDNLISLKGLENLAGINSLTITGNKLLENINGLEGLERITSNGWQGKFSVNGNPNLDSLNGLENLSVVEYDININNNNNLSDYCALSNLFENNGLGGNFNVSDNQYNPTSAEIINGNCSE